MRKNHAARFTLQSSAIFMRLKHKVREIGAGMSLELLTTTNRLAVREIRVTVPNISHGDTAHTAKNTSFFSALRRRQPASLLYVSASVRENFFGLSLEGATAKQGTFECSRSGAAQTIILQ
jgi:hypothetical protein